MVILGVAVETDAALAITPSVAQTVVLGLTVETDTALGLSTGLELSLASETDTALTITPSLAGGSIVPLLMQSGVFGMEFLGELREDTASQTRLLPQFVDSTDGVTPETGLTIANTDIRVSKNGAAFANKNSGGATHLETGIYSVVWNATDASDSGLLYVRIAVAGAAPLFGYYKVLPTNIYDLNQNDTAALNFSEALQTSIRVEAASGSTTTLVAQTIAPASTEDDQFNGRWMYFLDDTTTAALRGVKAKITDYVHSTSTFTLESEAGGVLNEAVADGDTAYIGG